MAGTTEEGSWLDQWAPRPIEEIPPVPLARAIPTLHAAAIMALQMTEYPKGLNAWLQENQATIALIGQHRPDLLQDIQRRTQLQRHKLLAAAIAGAASAKALQEVADKNAKSFDLLGRDRADLVEDLRNLFRIKRGQLKAAA